MGYEVEVKFRVEEHHALIARLENLGATARARLEQVDLYLNHPCRDFAFTGEAFRIRRDNNRVCLTYKGPKHTGAAKIREEFEIPLADGPDVMDSTASLFQRLGFQTVLEIRKNRLPFHLHHAGQDVSITLDQVQNLGLFTEVETLVLDKSLIPQAQELVLSLAHELGLHTIEPRSYLRMALEAARA